MEQIDKVRRVLLRSAQQLEERALALEEEKAQDALLDQTVSLKILAELRRFKGSTN